MGSEGPSRSIGSPKRAFIMLTFSLSEGFHPAPEGMWSLQATPNQARTVYLVFRGASGFGPGAVALER
uniref:Uncharacterized protein n=1 Tax=Oryza barthii TaxID=65489 RepID=A0A0D3FB80_9ORYZ